MRKCLVMALCLLGTPALAQTTPSNQVYRLCASLNSNVKYSPSNTAAVSAACGTPEATAATVAGGAIALESLTALHAAVAADTNAAISSGAM